MKKHLIGLLLAGAIIASATGQCLAHDKCNMDSLFDGVVGVTFFTSGMRGWNTPDVGYISLRFYRTGTYKVSFREMAGLSSEQKGELPANREFTVAEAPIEQVIKQKRIPFRMIMIIEWDGKKEEKEL